MIRTHVQLGPDQTELLDRLSDSLGVSKTAVLRFGLSLLALAAKEAKAGNAVGIVRGERVVKEVAGIWTTAEAQTEKVPA